MFEIFIIGFLFVSVSGHTNANEADMQSSLMPQELNPAFVANKDEPWRAIMPISAVRVRREVEPQVEHPVTFATQLQRYSRMTACAVLAIAAVVEIVLYVLDAVP